jgi:DNA polymerase III sliding clamp (beta) subunit (PCNA family)
VYLIGMSPEDYPDIVDNKETFLTVNLPRKELVARMEFVEHAMAHNDVRAYLNGMLFELEGNTLSLVATDGHRLAQSAGLELDSNHNKARIIAPRAAVKSLIAAGKADKGGHVVMTTHENHWVSVASGATTVHFRSTDMKYPDVQRLFPNETREVFTWPKDVEGVLDEIKVLNEKEGFPHNIRIEPVAGGYKANLKPFPKRMKVEGDGVSLDPLYVSDAIKVLSGAIVVGLSGPTSATVWKGTTHTGLTILIMPAR